MGPIFKRLKDEFSTHPARFLLLDRTSADSTRRSYASARIAGLSDPGGLTGYTGVILFVDGVTEEVTHRYGPGQTEALIRWAVMDNLKLFLKKPYAVSQ